MRLVFLGSPPFATPVLERLIASCHDVAALVTPPDRPRGRGRAVVESPLVALAREAGAVVIQPTTTKDPAFVKALAACEPDVLCVASYGEILRADVLELAPHGALNVHGSLLPRWRGASPVQAAIAAGDTETGISVQRMVLALDEGDVLVERRIAIGADENAGELFARLADMGGDVLIEALDQLEAGTATFTPQDHQAATVCRKLKKEQGVIDWSRDTADLERHVRAMTPWPGARTVLADGRALVVQRARACTGSGAPGELLSDDHPIVATGDGALELLEVKPAGKGVMDGASFLRGARLSVGTLFGEDH